MHEDDELSAIVGVFAHYGFRKTSMNDVARAIGISRQALYKRFDSKEALFRWAANSLVESARDAALEALAETAPLDEKLLAAFDQWSGRHVDMLRASPHSAEMIVMAGTEAGDLSSKAEKAINREVAKRLLEKRRGLSKSEAEDRAYTLFCTSKGLLYLAESRKAYLSGMRRAIRALAGA